MYISDSDTNSKSDFVIIRMESFLTGIPIGPKQSLYVSADEMQTDLFRIPATKKADDC